MAASMEGGSRTSICSISKPRSGSCGAGLGLLPQGQGLGQSVSAPAGEGERTRASVRPRDDPDQLLALQGAQVSRQGGAVQDQDLAAQGITRVMPGIRRSGSSSTCSLASKILDQRLASP
jgi:hypothetical protein